MVLLMRHIADADTDTHTHMASGRRTGSVAYLIARKLKRYILLYSLQPSDIACDCRAIPAARN